jgi:hypothetical protein
VKATGTQPKIEKAENRMTSQPRRQPPSAR